MGAHANRDSPGWRQNMLKTTPSAIHASVIMSEIIVECLS